LPPHLQVAPALYTKTLVREMPRIEMLFKIIAAPKDRFADTIKALWPEVSQAELVRVGELKGLGKKDQADVLAAMGMAGAKGGAAGGGGGGGFSALTAAAAAALGGGRRDAAAAGGSEGVREGGTRMGAALSGMGKLFGAKGSGKP